MGHQGQTDSDAQADAFFAQFIDAAPDVIARVTAEGSGDLAAIVADDRAFGYWARKMAERAGRRAARQAAELAERRRIMAEAPHLQQPAPRIMREVARDVAVVLPAPRVVTLTDTEREETCRWWHALATRQGIRARLRALRAEVGNPRAEARARAVWQAEQRAFERAEWRAVVVNRTSRPARKKANRWIAIDEDRALAIALAALDKQRPPQGRK